MPFDRTATVGSHPIAVPFLSRRTASMSRDRCYPYLLHRAMLACFAIAISSGGAACVLGDDREAFFESRIRPLLIKHCIDCHSGEEPKGGLSLSSREEWMASGAVSPGIPSDSLLVKAIRYEDPDLKMPPPDQGGKLSDREIDDIEKWITEGAFDPRMREKTPPTLGPKKRNRIFEITQEDRNHWAYQPLIPSPENTLDRMAAAKKIDELLDEPMKKRGIVPNAKASPRELVRRAYFDLWGLPPDPLEVAAFEKNPDEQAWHDLIERLLQSPHYGERWGRYWLDWVRYAETNGYERDGPKPNSWRYRDYVIRAFNEDKPYDQFVVEQLAGDQWIVERQWTVEQNPKEWTDSVIATGFYRLHVWDDEPDNTDVAELDDLDDIIITTGNAFLGLTLGCARCHDHKFDPYSQVDYYSVLSFFRDIDPYGLSNKGGGSRGTGKIQRLLVSDTQLRAWDDERIIRMRELDDQIIESSSTETKAELEKQRLQLQQLPPPFDSALSVLKADGPEKTTFVLFRGEVQSPRQQVMPNVPEILRGHSAISTASLQSRLQFAKWIASPRHPLTARVLVNRLWQRHLGVGIVPTPDDFGVTGQAPSNSRLLDFLANDFIRNDWSIKSIHRAILLSDAYRRASSVANDLSSQVDPENVLLWRQNLRRLDAEAIRDSMLSYAGNLNQKQNGPSVYPQLSQEVRLSANPISIINWSESPREEQSCRSVFLVVKRSLKTPLLESFDFNNSDSAVAARSITTTAPQALMLLNDEFVQHQSEILAERIQAEVDPISKNAIEIQLQRLWSVVLQRAPTLEEQLRATEFHYQQFRQNLETGKSIQESTRLAWVSLCRSLFNCNEAVYVD